MPVAFILISVDAGKEREIIQQLRAIENVKDVYLVYGVYDIVAKVEADTLDEIKKTINLRMRKLANVRSTQTMLSIE